jgi:tetratricopeptide (TPR) repeat protein
MGIGKYLLAAALMATAAPVGAGVTVLGSSSARMCFEAADAKSAPSHDSLTRCDQAMEEENLTEFDRVATYVNRGIVKLRLGNVDSSIVDFDNALRRDPNQAEAYLNRGMAELRRPEGWQEAAAMFDDAIARNTRRPALAYFGRAVANELGGRIRNAWLDYRQASRLDPKWRDPQIELTRFTVR